MRDDAHATAPSRRSCSPASIRARLGTLRRPAADQRRRGRPRRARPTIRRSLSQRAAASSTRKTGDTLTIFVNGQERQITVAGIVENELASGVRGFGNPDSRWRHRHAAPGRPEPHRPRGPGQYHHASRSRARVHDSFNRRTPPRRRATRPTSQRRRPERRGAARRQPVDGRQTLKQGRGRRTPSTTATSSPPSSWCWGSSRSPPASC